jgi:hypothetical protein
VAMCRNCFSLLMQRSTRLRFRYLRFENEISPVLLDFGGMTGGSPDLLSIP